MANYESPSLDADQKDGKKKINPREKHKKFISDIKADIVGDAIILGVVELVVIPLSILIGSLSELEGGWYFLLTFGCCSIPVIIFFICAVFKLKRLKALVSGAYSLITDTVERVVIDDKYVYQSKHSYYEHAMYLYRCGRVVISLEETCLYSEGDICYVFVYDDMPDTPIAVYNTKYYELDEVEEARS